MRRWLALGVFAVVVVWYSYLGSSRAPRTEESAAPDSSTPPLTAATPVAPAVAPAPPSPVTPRPPPRAPAAEPTPAAEPQAQPVPDRGALFGSRFDAEPRDAFWANDQEPNLQKLLAEAKFGDQDITEVACRRTVCRVTFKGPRVSESRAIALYSRVLASFGDAQLAMHDANSGEPAHFYALRKGYKLDAPH